MSFLFRNWWYKIYALSWFFSWLWSCWRGWVLSWSFLCLLGPAYPELAVAFDCEHLGCDTWCCLCWDSQVAWGEFRLFLWNVLWSSCHEAKVVPSLAFSLRVRMQEWLWQKAFKVACGTVAVWGAGPGACSSWCLLSWGRNLNEVETWIRSFLVESLCVRAWTEENAKSWMSASFVVGWFLQQTVEMLLQNRQGREWPSENGVFIRSRNQKKYSCTILHKFYSLKNWDV